MSDKQQYQGVAALLSLEQQAWETNNAQALGFCAVNETHNLIEYRQAVLFEAHSTQRISAVSGLPVLQRDAPFMQWMLRLNRYLFRQNHKQAQVLTVADVPDAMAEGWQEWLPKYVVWVPLNAGRKRLGGMLLVRDKAWTQAETTLLNHLRYVYAHVWFAHLAKESIWSWQHIREQWFGNRWRFWGLMAVVLVVLFAPVRQTVLAPAEVRPLEAQVVRSPLAGIVDKVNIEPNQPVHEGDVLLTLDDDEIRTQLQVANKETAMLEAKYQQLVQRSFRDVRSKASLMTLRAKAMQKREDVEFLQKQMDKLEIRAPRDGLALFTDSDDLIGRPVRIGERLVVIADPTKAEVRMMLPVGNSLLFPEEADVSLFLNMEPTHSIPAKLTYTAYQAQQDSGGVLAYEMKAAFMPGEVPPRIGLRGVAKVYGERVPMIYYLLRRPLAVARQTLGW
ncbi:MAG: HlyD family efflux transporter periplasmic adaptor subunit [Mariprofundaceae bacterium]|nr:HlyD family efflux transporter periplasmic adaptor subunit [Mariprofundaceae bacterium]